MQLTEVFGAEPLRALPPRLKFVQSQGQLVLTWDDRRYLLERARSVNGPWQRAAAPTIPYPVEPSGEASFFRLRR
jgi:hypothetical protein